MNKSTPNAPNPQKDPTTNPWNNLPKLQLWALGLSVLVSALFFKASAITPSRDPTTWIAALIVGGLGITLVLGISKITYQKRKATYLLEKNAPSPKHRERDELTGTVAIIQSHSFDQIFQPRRAENLENLKSQFQTEYLRALGVAQTAAEAALANSQSPHIRVVFTPEVANKLQSGELKLWTDPQSKTISIDPRDAKGRFGGEGRIKIENGDNVRRIGNAIVGIAHVISSIDTQIQLEDIAQKIGDLQEYVRMDRAGELRGKYSNLQKAMLISDAHVRENEIRSIIRDLGTLEGRFHQTAMSVIHSISDPANINFRQALFSTDKSAEAKLRNSISVAFTDLFAADFCNFLICIAHCMISDGSGAEQTRKILRQRYTTILPLLTAKIAYIDPDRANVVKQKMTPLIQESSESITPNHEGGAA